MLIRYRLYFLPHLLTHQGASGAYCAGSPSPGTIQDLLYDCRIVGFFTGSPSHFDPDLGYHFPQLHITIDRSCSGLNFLVMAFCMIGISTLSFYRRLGPQVLALAIGALATYLLTLGATSSRILIAIRSWQLRELYPWLASDRMHQQQGGIVYLFFLILFYLLTTFLLQNMSQRYA